MPPTPKQKSNTPNPKRATRQGTSNRCATWTTRHLQTGPENTPPRIQQRRRGCPFFSEGEEYQGNVLGLRKMSLGRKEVGMATLYLGVSKNNGTPKTIHFNRVFHYKPSILGYPYFWKHPFISGDIFQERRHFQAEKLPNDFGTPKLSISGGVQDKLCSPQPQKPQPLCSAIHTTVNVHTIQVLRWILSGRNGLLRCGSGGAFKGRTPCHGAGHVYWRDQWPSFHWFPLRRSFGFRNLYELHNYVCQHRILNVHCFLSNNYSFPLNIACEHL